MLEKTLESPLDCKEIQPVHSEGDQPWDFIGRTEVEAETPVLWPPDVKNQFIGKDPELGKMKAGEGDLSHTPPLASWMVSQQHATPGGGNSG